MISDKQSVENLAKGVESMTEPVRDKMRQGMTMLGEAKQRAKYDQEPIGIFSLLKLLKDPSVQSGLQFLKALLEVNYEKSTGTLSSH